MNDARPTLDTPAVHPAYVRLLCQLLRNRGIDADPALRAAGLGSWQQLAASDALVTHRAANQLIRACLRASGKPWLGLELGMAVQASAHGAMGYAVAASRDLHQALGVIARYAPSRNAALRFHLHDTPEGAAFELIERVELGDVREFVTTMLFAAIVRLMEAVLGRRPDTLAVDLPFSEPPWRAEIDRVFTGHIRFGRPRLVFQLDRELLSQPCLTADAPAFERARMDCERALAATLDASLLGRVRELMQGRPDGYPTLAETAGFLHMSTRTLIRKLKAEGTQFQDVLDTLRKERALGYLKDTRLSVDEIAAQLGYEDTSNFSRTFRRWFGVTPSEVRDGAAVSGRPGEA